MRPPPWRRMCGMAARMVCSGPQKCTAIDSSKSSTVTCSIGPTVMMPALLTSTSMAPCRLITASTARSAAAPSARSETMIDASMPSPASRRSARSSSA